MCIKISYIVLRPILNTTYNGEIQVEIFMRALQKKRSYSNKVGIVFAMYQRMRLKRICWAGTRHTLVMFPEHQMFYLKEKVLLYFLLSKLTLNLLI